MPVAAGYAIFHLNLAYSSIEAAQQRAVIECCYTPLLDLVEDHDVPLGVELTGWTLRRIAALDHGWLSRLGHLLSTGKCELIGSGYAQIIGPLVPYDVNVWNQRLGLDDYRNFLGVRPRLALVNEMAYSSGLVDVYADAGYGGIVMDRDNVCLALGMDDGRWPPLHAAGRRSTLPVLWSDSIMFQRLQRFAHGDIRLRDYLDYLRLRQGRDELVPLYCNDAEVFDFRPGRFREESDPHAEGEWKRIAQLFAAVRQEGMQLLLPSAALEMALQKADAVPQRLVSANQPVPVKKQAKYNVSRWAVTGRDDLWLNTWCHRLYRALRVSPRVGEARMWRRLCDGWASDLRTHITPARWRQARRHLVSLSVDLGVTMPSPEALPMLPSADSTRFADSGFEVVTDDEGMFLTIRTAALTLVLNLRRGLAVHSLGFAAHDFAPILGTLPLGYFNSIALGADFYTGAVVVERITEHDRITDLEWTQPALSLHGDVLCISADVPSHGGIIRKSYRFNGVDDVIAMRVEFPGWRRPYGTVRIGHFTLLPEAFSGILHVEYGDGAAGYERLPLLTSCRHAQPASTLVSCTTALGVPEGMVRLGDESRGIEISWAPDQCAALPMLLHLPSPPAALTRLVFSLSELDETFRPGGTLLPFECRVRPV